MTSQHTAGPSTEQQPTSMQALYPARRRSLAGAWWAVRTLVQKKRITWEDRLGLFRYQAWIRTVEQPALRALLREAKNAAGEVVRPLFLIAGERISPAQAEATLDSLQQLQDADWSLVFFLPKNTSSVEEDWLNRQCSADPRVRACRFDHPDHLHLGGWQDKLRDLPGEWVIPIRAGDRISAVWPAVFRLYQQRFPRADILYWDEDQFAAGKSPSGFRERPVFKPGWSPELMFSVNILESAAFRKSYLLNAVRELDIFSAAFSARQVARIPVILQHRAPLSPQQTDMLRKQHEHSVKSYLQTLGAEHISATYTAQGNLRVRWQTRTAPLVSIIIPTRENLGYLQRCLASLLDRTEGVPYEIILMDDHSSSPEVLAYYRALETHHANIRVHHNQEAFNYSRVNNHGARLAKGSLLLFLNNDVEILDADWLAEMVRWAELPGVGMVGARLLYPDQSIQHAGIVLGMTGHAGHIYAGSGPAASDLFFSPDVCRNVSAVTGACILVRREVFEQMGGFDEELILVFNDVDLCLRVQNAGWRVVYAPAATLIHYEGRSRSRYMPPRDISLGAQRLSGIIEQGDPYFHPSLSLAVNWPTFRRKGEPAALRRLKDIVRYKG